ncbi:MAG: tetratricopeptide repeat protein [Desulfitobacterium sp.]|mgnify:CR=1 FL=1|nr:tetratricopeptide repeat protein [Desulfitobacterium sp.]
MVNKELFHKGIEYLEKSRYKDAEEAFLQYIELVPEDAEAYNKLGTLYGKTNHLEKAKKYLSKAVEINPEMVSTWNNLGNIARLEGSLEEAGEYYRKALAIDPESPIPARNLKLVERQAKWSLKKFVNLFKKKDKG